MTIADHQLDNMVTAIYIRKGIDEDSTGFRQHPLMLRSRRDSNAITDFSILTVPLPLAMKQRGSTELIEMISPVRELCKRLGDRLPAGEWNYDCTPEFLTRRNFLAIDVPDCFRFGQSRRRTHSG